MSTTRRRPCDVGRAILVARDLGGVPHLRDRLRHRDAGDLRDLRNGELAAVHLPSGNRPDRSRLGAGREGRRPGHVLVRLDATTLLGAGVLGLIAAMLPEAHDAKDSARAHLDHAARRGPGSGLRAAVLLALVACVGRADLAYCLRAGRGGCERVHGRRSGAQAPKRPPAARSSAGYELIKSEITSVQLNSVLFQAADKGCEPLARRAARRRRRGRGARSSRRDAALLCGALGAPRAGRSAAGKRRADQCPQPGRLDRAVSCRRERSPRRGAAAARQGRRSEPVRTRRGHADRRRGLQGQRPHRRGPAGAWRRSERDRQDRQGADRLCGGARLHAGRAAAARCRRRRQRPLRQRSHRADVGGGLCGERRRARRRGRRQAPARSRRRHRCGRQSRPLGPDDGGGARARRHRRRCCSPAARTVR